MIYKIYVISRPENDKGLSWDLFQNKKGISAIMSVSRDPGYRIMHFLILGVGEKNCSFPVGERNGREKGYFENIIIFNLEKKIKINKKKDHLYEQLSNNII